MRGCAGSQAGSVSSVALFSEACEERASSFSSASASPASSAQPSLHLPPEARRRGYPRGGRRSGWRASGRRRRRPRWRRSSGRPRATASSPSPPLSTQPLLSRGPSRLSSQPAGLDLDWLESWRVSSLKRGAPVFAAAIVASVDVVPVFQTKNDEKLQLRQGSKKRASWGEAWARPVGILCECKVPTQQQARVKPQTAAWAGRTLGRAKHTRCLLSLSQ